MVIDNTFHSEYSTIAGKLDYEIGFEYFTNPDNTPQLRVQLNDNDLSYGVDYTLSGDGLSIVLDSDPGLDGALIIRRSVPFTQTSDYTVGRIDPEQIEKDFDLMVMRDQEIADYFDWLATDHFALADYVNNFGDIVEHDASEFVQKSGDTMTGALKFTNGTDTQDIQLKHYGAGVPGFIIERASNSVGFLFDFAITGGMYPQADNTLRIGTPSRRLARVYTKKISGSSTYGNEIDVPETGGTMALLSDLPSTAADVHALPDTTKYGASLVATIDPSTFVMTLTLKDQDGYTLGSSQTIDLPLESVVVSGTYDSATKEVVLTLQSGSTIRFSVADLVSGLQTEITSLNMLDADLVDDSTSTNKFVTAAEKSAISTAVQPGDLASVATSGLYSDLSGTPTIPDTTHMVTDNTAQNISAVKTFTAANPDSTTAQTIVANYAVKFGTSGNNDLFAISANTNTSTLSIVGDNASNIIDIAASGAVLNHFQVTSSDVTFGGNSLINPGVMTGADGVNAGTSGLVPAPAATDDDKFLCGDGTWKAAGGGGGSLPSQTGHAGTVLTTDGTDASWDGSINHLNFADSGSWLCKIGYQTVSGYVCFGLKNAYDTELRFGWNVNQTAFVSSATQPMLGTSDNKWFKTYTETINNGANITVPTTGGTMAVVGVNTTVTLEAANWAGGSQTVSVTGMTATGIVFVSPDPSDQADYTSAGILCTAQAAGTLTFTCDTTPSNDIDVVVVMM